MRRLQSDTHFRHALYALQSPDGYVDALMEMAREQTAPRRPAISFSTSPHASPASRGEATGRRTAGG